MAGPMRTLFKIILSLLATAVSTYFFEVLFEQLARHRWFGYNIFMEDTEDFNLGYALGYLLIFYLFLFFRWPTTPKRVLLSSIVILGASLLSVLTVLTRNFWHTTLDLAGVYQRVQGSFAAVFATNLVVLVFINLLFWLVKKPASKPLFTGSAH